LDCENTKQSLDVLARTMSVIPMSELGRIIGAYDPYDCMWHCLAYAESSGNNYGDSAVYSMAQRYSSYMGISFNPDSYAYEGVGYYINYI